LVQGSGFRSSGRESAHYSGWKGLPARHDLSAPERKIMKAKRAPNQLSCHSASPEVATAAISRKFYSRPMKGIINGVIVFAVALLAPQILQAQGTMTYLSNVDQASAGSLAVGSDSWVAAMFRTGTNPSGYLVDSIQLELTDASGTPSGFTAMLYSSIGGVAGPVPNYNLDTLSGSLNPVTGGIFTYTPTPIFTLSPNTRYFIVLTSGTTVATGAYEWNYKDANTYNPSDSWSVGGVLISNGGQTLLPDYPQFAINAIPIPEPGVLALSGLGGLLLLCRFASPIFRWKSGRAAEGCRSPRR
jgi:hypothetical protein